MAEPKLPLPDGTRTTTERLLVAYTERHPEKTYQQIADFAGVSLATLTRVLKKHGFKRSCTLNDGNVAARLEDKHE